MYSALWTDVPPLGRSQTVCCHPGFQMSDALDRQRSTMGDSFLFIKSLLIEKRRLLSALNHNSLMNTGRTAPSLV